MWSFGSPYQYMSHWRTPWFREKIFYSTLVAPSDTQWSLDWLHLFTVSWATLLAVFREHNLFRDMFTSHPAGATLSWLSLCLTNTCTSQVLSSLLDIFVRKEGNVLGLWEGLKEWQRWGCCSSVCRLAPNGGEKWVCQELTSKELWTNEVWQNCAKGVFVERILSVLCIFLLSLSAWIEASPLNYQLLHYSSMFLQPVQSGICLYMVARMQSLLVPLMWEAAKYNYLKIRKKKKLRYMPVCNSAISLSSLSNTSTCW